MTLILKFRLKLLGVLLIYCFTFRNINIHYRDARLKLTLKYDVGDFIRNYEGNMESIL